MSALRLFTKKAGASDIKLAPTMERATGLEPASRYPASGVAATGRSPPGPPISRAFGAGGGSGFPHLQKNRDTHLWMSL